MQSNVYGDTFTDAIFTLISQNNDTKQYEMERLKSMFLAEQYDTDAMQYDVDSENLNIKQ